MNTVALGLILVALLPDVAEIVNGIKFALEDNIALSIEVGSSIAVQVCMLQIPFLVILGEIFFTDEESINKKFTLVFPELYVFAVIFALLVMCYTFQNGRSDYFQGNISLSASTFILKPILRR